jgi:hypothetical protein
MPIRRRSGTPTKPVALREALNWLAFDDFSGPMTGAEIEVAITGATSNVETLEFDAFQREPILEEARNDLFVALHDGDIQARGRFSDRSTDQSSANDWREQQYEKHAAERSDVPADFWYREGVNWEANTARSPKGEYAYIILDREAVLSVWPLEKAPDDSGETTGGGAGRKRGPKERYSEREFLGLCAWEMAINDLPRTQDEMVGRMAKLCAVIWGEDDTPGDTWIKRRVKYVLDLREKYERGRQLVEGSGNSDRGKTPG